MRPDTDEPLRLHHGMSRWSWELVRWQGRMRPARDDHDGTRIYRIVGEGGRCYFTADSGLAAVYAGGRADKRVPTWPTGRWALPGGIANRDGVVVACDFKPDEVTYTHRERSHAEYLYDGDVPVERLRVVAFIREGRNVFDALRAGRPCPPLDAQSRARVRAIGRDQTLVLPGILLAELEEYEREAARRDAEPRGSGDRSVATIARVLDAFG